MDLSLLLCNDNNERSSVSNRVAVLAVCLCIRLRAGVCICALRPSAAELYRASWPVPRRKGVRAKRHLRNAFSSSSSSASGREGTLLS